MPLLMATGVADPTPSGPRPSGRPTKLTPGVAAWVCRAIAGNAHSMASAARRLGVCPRSMKRWASRGRRDRAAGRDTPHAAFAAQLDAAYHAREVLLFGPGGRRGTAPTPA